MEWSPQKISLKWHSAATLGVVFLLKPSRMVVDPSLLCSGVLSYRCKNKITKYSVSDLPKLYRVAPTNILESSPGTTNMMTFPCGLVIFLKINIGLS